MSLNTKEIDLILSELDLPGSYIQKIVQSDFQSLFFSLYKPGNKFDLKISLSPGKTRLCRTLSKGKKGAKLQRFEQFLRSRILSGRITEASQPGKDRIVKLAVKKGGAETNLYIRLWGGNANIIAADENNIILDAFYRRPGKNEQSGSSFALPDKKGKNADKFTVRDFSDSEDFNAYIDRYYREIEDKETIERLQNKLLNILNKRLVSLEAKIKSREQNFDKYDSAESFKEYGDLLLSFSHKWVKGAKWLDAENYYDNNNSIRIEVDPDISIEKNADKYFSRYKKLKKSRDNFLDELENLENRRNRLKKQIKEAENETNIKTLTSLLKSTESEARAETGKQLPGLQFFSGGFIILVGRGAKENDELLRHHVKGNDYWLHARDYPGGYVFIKNIKGKSVPLETLLDAGNLAVFYSKGKNSGKGEVYYTQVKYLRRTKNGKTGLVIPTQEKNLSVTVDDKRIKKLFEKENIL